MTTSPFALLGLAEPLLRALDGENYTQPTEIQQKAIPELLTGRDLLGVAQTGTGKTAAFALPIIQLIAAGRDESLNRKKARGKEARVLVLLPTRELAVQVAGRFDAYGRHYGLRCAVIVGGVSAHAQRRTLKLGVDVVVATPGRLLDHLKSGDVHLGDVTHLVLDEADRMLDMGFIRDVRRIISALPAERQNLLFSATMPKDVEILARDILRNPVKVEIAPETPTAERIEQFLIRLPREKKRSALIRLLDNPAWNRVIVFTRTKHGANRVAKQLDEAGIPADAIHGNKAQNARQAALDKFGKGKIRVLVATDIAARGIDVRDISHVLNFELPNEPETYVHRIGRTARAGTGGIAVSLCDSSENQHLKKIERLTGIHMTPMTVAGIETDTSSLTDDRDDEPVRRRSNSRQAPGDRPARRNEAPARADGARKDRGGDKRPRPAAKAADGRTAPRPPARREDSADAGFRKAPRPANDERPQVRREAGNNGAPARQDRANGDGASASSGKVKWYNVQKGYGFIEPDDGGRDIFLHASALEISGIGDPKEGLRVGYRIERNKRDGKMCAANLRVA